jgi:hypothetical protein
MQHLQFKEQLIFETDSLTDLDYEVNKKEVSFGVYKVHLLTTILSAQKDTLNSAWWSGVINQDTSALYIVDKGNPVKYKGNVAISGNVEISSLSNVNEKLRSVIYAPSKLQFNGSLLESQNSLPVLVTQFKVPEVLEEFRFRESELYTNILKHSFKEETIEILLDNTVVNDMVLSNNIILSSKRKVVITSNNYLKNVLIIAPEVEITAGFTGKLQIKASEKITIRENVTLEEGSSLWLEGDAENKIPSISIGPFSEINAVCVMLRSKNQSFFSLDKNAAFNGMIYNQGVTEANGVITGSLYTEEIGERKGEQINLNLISNLIIKIPTLKNVAGLKLKDRESSKVRIIAKAS